jgi:hypothetical protein
MQNDEKKEIKKSLKSILKKTKEEKDKIKKKLFEERKKKIEEEEKVKKQINPILLNKFFDLIMSKIDNDELSKYIYLILLFFFFNYYI